MATTNPIPETTAPPVRAGADLLVLLAAMPPEHRQAVLANLNAVFAHEEVVIASPDPLPEETEASFRFIPASASKVNWTLTAADFVSAYQLADKNQARAILMLGPESSSLSPAELHSLAGGVLNASVDLAVPCYALPPYAGLFNSAILYPVTRALFASRVRFPLAADLGMSLRMSQHMAVTAQRFTGANQGETPVWPVNEATVAGFAIEQFPVSPQPPSHSNRPDLNTILPFVTGPLFSDIEVKAAYWQRFRTLPPPFQLPPSPQARGAEAVMDIAPMLQAFRLAHTNLQEIWSLVLPPASLLGLKRLSATDAAAFRISDNLWARIVYDFLLAYRLRTLNRGHLLGALIPLYLAWVASHINITASGIDPERHIEELAAAFETEKPYMVSRWRWPDRFNP